jgi:hypothetical protein
MMKFQVTFFNEQDAGRILGHFTKQGFSHSLVDRCRKGPEFLSTYEVTRKRGLAS